MTSAWVALSNGGVRSVFRSDEAGSFRISANADAAAWLDFVFGHGGRLELFYGQLVTMA